MESRKIPTILGESFGRKGRIVNVVAATGLFSGAMVSCAFPEELGVGAADVVGVKGKSIGELVLLRKPIADQANTWSEKGRDLLDRFVQGETGGPLVCLRQAMGIGGHPVNIS